MNYIVFAAGACGLGNGPGRSVAPWSPVNQQAHQIRDGRIDGFAGAASCAGKVAAGPDPGATPSTASGSPGLPAPASDCAGLIPAATANTIRKIAAMPVNPTRTRSPFGRAATDSDIPDSRLRNAIDPCFLFRSNEIYPNDIGVQWASVTPMRCAGSGGRRSRQPLCRQPPRIVDRR